MKDKPKQVVVLAVCLVWLVFCVALALGLRRPLTCVEEISPPAPGPTSSIEYGLTNVNLADGLSVTGFVYQQGEGQTPVYCRVVAQDMDTGRCFALPTMLVAEESLQAPGFGYDVGFFQRGFYAAATEKELRRAGLEPGARLGLFLYYENNQDVFWVDTWRYVRLTE